MDDIASSSTANLSVPYNERWDLLREVIVGLYIGENKKLKEIVEIMKINSQFYASEPQYKRQFKIWNLARALPSKKKDKIIKTLETRAQQGKSSMVLQKGKDDALNKCGNKVFMNWTMSAEVLKTLKSNARLDHPSPTINILSPGHARSPRHEVFSVTESVKSQRAAALFVQGRHSELFQGMNLDQQIAITDWMHKFWLFSFGTARTWGHGSPSWNTTNHASNDFLSPGHHSLPSTLSMNMNSLGENSSAAGLQHDRKCKSHLPDLNDLCLWSIHCRGVEYNSKADPKGVIEDPEDETTWRQEDSPRTINDFVDILASNLETNDFSEIRIDDLPISVGQIIKAVKRSPEQLLEEAFGFSIMARNIELVTDMLEKIRDISNFSFDNLFPLHLAASYLNGAKDCCLIFGNLMNHLNSGHIHVRRLYTNHLGHTVLDNLMITILKSHSTCPPYLVDEAFKKEHRFSGEEVDTCGRWDADSDCVRILQHKGHPTIPSEWKHMFCHTSVQAITH
ncbi:Clr5 domain-containing protein [Amylocarpus encephaloides]|uniref:Clr5 domain-containing protein n=1 Tax=Amylocarpus encephaloides TaxID=45428 RepID=A0A9P7YMJ2_9HELO|nr:Clr5 domain-containing protein [Amylocarpus encephaloides]